FDIVADEQVDPAIAVIVQPGRRRRPAGVLNAAGCRYVNESACTAPIRAVVKETAAPDGRYEQVVITIVIVVADRDAHSLYRHIQPDLCAYVGIGSVIVIAVEGQRGMLRAEG